MKKNIAVIGTGVQGSRFLRTISKFNEFNVSAVCNQSGRFGEYKCYSDWKDVLALPLDGLIVAADPLLHHSILQMANFREVPVLVEKPLGLYLSDVQKMLKFRNKILVDYTHLFSPPYLQIKEYCQKVGIKQIAAINYNHGPFRHFSSLYDYLPHDLSMILDLVNKPKAEFSIVEQQASSGKNGGLLYRLQLQLDKTQIDILCGNGGEKKARKLAVFLDNGQKYVYDATQMAEEDYHAPLKNVLKHFGEIMDGAAVKVPMEMSLKIHNLLYKLSKENL